MNSIDRFERAALRWPVLARSTNEEDYRDLCTEERNILTRVPRSAKEVGVILDVLIAQDGDPRTDGRDWAALRRVRRFIGRLSG